MAREQIRFPVKLTVALTSLFFIAMWVFYGTTKNLFVWDSIPYLYHYEDQISELGLQNLKWMTTAFVESNWHPLTWFSWAVDYQLYGGLVPWGFHLSNNLIHAINGLAVFMLVWVFLGLLAPVSGKFSLRKDNATLTATFLVALLYVVHPQHVEPVAWVAERKDLLCQLFLLLALMSYVKFVTSDQGNRRTWYMLTLCLFILALLSKPMAVTFPVVLLLADIFPLRRSGLQKPVIDSIDQRTARRLLVEKIPFFALSVGLVVLTLVAQEGAISSFPMEWRVVNALNSIVFYLEKFLLPIQLSPHYPYFLILDEASMLRAAWVVAALLGITAGVLLAWRRNHTGWAIAWLFYLVTLAPVMGIIQVGAQGAADRYAHFTTLPLYLLLALLIFSTLRDQDRKKSGTLIVVLTVVIALFGLQSRKQVSIWKNEVSLWSHAVQLHSGHTFARYNLGTAFLNFGDFENAVRHFEAGSKAASAHPANAYVDSVRMLKQRGMAYMHLGRYESALQDQKTLLEMSGSDAGLESMRSCIEYNVGWNHAQLGQFHEAINRFENISEPAGLSADASTWLEFLTALTQESDDKTYDKAIPGFCVYLKTAPIGPGR